MFLGPSNTAGEIDTAFLIITGMCVALFVIVITAMLYFLVKYNKKRHPQPEKTGQHIVLEITWTVIPVILVLIMFYVGWVDFDAIRNPPKGAMPVNVIGRQWSWSFHYGNGKEADVLRVPLGKPVELILTSEDVLHSFYIPAYRIKEDTVPGMKTHLWFIANTAGSYDIFCTEYCGLAHSHMLSKLIAMPEGDFNAWYQSRGAAGKEGKELEVLKGKGCLGCHSTDGTRKVGPTLKGLFGRQVTVVTGGKERTLTADEDYLRRSILDPQADIVKGYPPIMPKIPMTQEELDEIVEYLKTLK
ncbi:MAG TPA: cytochrome c oxidase subunit II [Dissulfurispiraceae bacterium]